MPDYETMSAQDALLHAKDVSGLTADEISRRAGVSPHILRRYFKATEPEYLPGLERIPALCRAMGNLVLLHWLEARCAALRPALPSAGNRADVLTAVARAAVSSQLRPRSMSHRTLASIASPAPTVLPTGTSSPRAKKASSALTNSAPSASEQIAG